MVWAVWVMCTTYFESYAWIGLYMPYGLADSLTKWIIYLYSLSDGQDHDLLFLEWAAKLWRKAPCEEFENALNEAHKHLRFAIFLYPRADRILRPT